MEYPAFISYARTDSDRVKSIVNYLTSQKIPVWWDEKILPGQAFRFVIEEVLRKAGCVIVVWSYNSTQQRIFVTSEADEGLRRGVLIPVLIDPVTASIPKPFGELQNVDLVGWDGQDNTEAQKLLDAVKYLVQRKTYDSNFPYALIDSPWAVEDGKNATDQLNDLVKKIDSIRGILLLEQKPVEDIRGALVEVNKTYDVVLDAIKEFTSPLISQGILPVAPYLTMEHDALGKKIRNGRGHCLNILLYYGGADGLREWLLPRIDDKLRDDLDEVFAALGTADGDMFERLENIGAVLTNESRMIANLILSGQEKLARQRILNGRLMLQPLEDALKNAQAQLQTLANSLGFVSI